MALLGADPVPGAPGAIGLMAGLAGWMAPMALVGAVYSGADRILVGAYAPGADALADQRSAGMVMWLGGTGVIVPVAIAVVLRALWREEERQRRRERAEGLS
jgi:cytochrome c oxidase assembly factor CtaG